MLREIKEQGNVIKRLVMKERETALTLGEAVRERGIQFIIIAARGTSDNAGTYGKYLFECVNGIPTAMAAPSVVTLYGSKLYLNNTMVIGVSQSGAGVDICRFLESARERGALTVAVTNTEDSLLECAAEIVLHCHAGEEKAVAATKTYTAELAAMVLLSWAISGSDNLLIDLQSCAGALDTMADHLSKGAEAAADRYLSVKEMVVLARGMNHATAMEVALKLQETSYIGAKGFSGADFVHGPLAMVEPGLPILIFAPPGAGSDSMGELFVRLKESHANITVVSSDRRYQQMVGAQMHMKIPIEVSEVLSPIPYVIAGQLFAYHLAIGKGYNPDNPRGLTKVTSTV